MGTLLSGNDRLAEMLAGSTAILSDSSGMSNVLPVSLTSVLGIDASGTVGDPSTAGSLNLLSPTDALAPVSTLLSDTPLNDLLGGDASSLGSVGNILNLGSHDDSALQLAGPDGTLQPVFNAVNAEIKDFHDNQLEVLGDQLHVPDILHGLTNTGETIGLGEIGVPTPGTDGHTNLVTDLLNAPSTLLNGGGLDAVVSQVGDDLTDIVHAANGLIDAVLSGDDTLNPVPGLIASLGNDLQNIPLLTINGGNNAGDGGLLGGIVGDLHGSSSGHLIDADIGPEQSSGGLVADLLGQPDSGPHHTVEVNAIDVGPSGPQLLDLGLLTGGNGVLSGGNGLLSGLTGATGLLTGGSGLLSDADGLHIPTLGGTGADGLVGNLLGGSSILSGNTTSAPVTAPVNVDFVHDLGSLITDHGVLDLHGTHII